MKFILYTLYGFASMLCQFPDSILQLPNCLTEEKYGENYVYRRQDQQFALFYKTKSGLMFKDINEDGINGNESLYSSL